MPRADLSQISRALDPRPALRSTSVSEAVSENVKAMWAESNAMTLRRMEQEILEDVRSEYVRATGRVPTAPPVVGEEFVTEDKRVLPLTEKNWLFDQISRLAPDERRLVTTPDMVDQRLINARDQVLKETSVRLEEASGTGRVVGALAGGAFAGLTDPFTVPFLPFGGFARPGLSAAAGILRVGAIEAGIGAATAVPGELINATMEERSGRRASIERAATNVGLAALGGFAFGGLIEGGIRFGRRVYNGSRIRGLTDDIATLRGIEREADAIGGAMQRAGVRVNEPTQRRAAVEAMEEAIAAFRDNDVPKARAAIATGDKVLGETPANFAARVKATYEDPQMQKLITDAAEAGQATKRAVAKAEKAAAEGAVPAEPGAVGTGPKRGVTPETAVVNDAFKAQKSTTARLRELNRNLPEGATVVRSKTTESGYAVRIADEDKASRLLPPIKNVKSARSISAALRSSGAYDPPTAPAADAITDAAPTVNSLDAREAEHATYQGIELEERVDAARQTLDQRFEGREDEKVFMEMDAEGNVVAQSLNDIKAADAKDDFLADEYKGCVTGG